jgi:hypothetical protein
VEILGLDRHYDRTLVDAKRTPQGYEVKTVNIRVLDLILPAGATREPVQVVIDGQELQTTPTSVRPGLHVFLEKREGQWATILPERYATERLRHLQKSPGLQGPIDDAFMSSFLVVQGTGKPWHEATDQYAEASRKRFAGEWSKYLRGEVPVKLDVDVTPEDIQNRHLILFGDPASNSLIAQALPGLPLQWTKEKITWDGQEYAAGEHVPVLIYPSPLNADRYVVLNSGHTFHASDFQGTNALLYPRLGDHALLKLGSGKDGVSATPVRSGIFDESWRFSK